MLTTYEYDSCNRLKTATTDGGDITTYTHDAAGNRTKVEKPGGETTYYDYDSLGRMVRAEPASGAVTFTYNADSQRVSKETPNGAVTGYLYDHKRLLQETDGVGGEVDMTYASATEEEYGELISQDGDGGSLHHQFDAQKNTVALADPQGDVVARFTYHAFGEVASVSIVGDAWSSLTADQWEEMTPDVWETLPVEITTKLAMGGRKGYYRDEETELYLMGMGGGGVTGNGTRGRYYDPVTGRFTSEDPIRHASGDANLQRYVGNDPINRVDPSGLRAGAGSDELIDTPDWALKMKLERASKELAEEMSKLSEPPPVTGFYRGANSSLLTITVTTVAQQNYIKQHPGYAEGRRALAEATDVEVKVDQGAIDRDYLSHLSAEDGRVLDEVMYRDELRNSLYNGPAAYDRRISPMRYLRLNHLFEQGQLQFDSRAWLELAWEYRRQAMEYGQRLSRAYRKSDEDAWERSVRRLRILLLKGKGDQITGDEQETLLDLMDDDPSLVSPNPYGISKQANKGLRKLLARKHARGEHPEDDPAEMESLIDSAKHQYGTGAERATPRLAIRKELARIASMTALERISLLLELAQESDQLSDAMKRRLHDLQGSLGVLATFFAAGALSQGTMIGVAVDAIAGALFGMQVIDIGVDLYDAIEGALSATTMEEFLAASKSFDDAMTKAAVIAGLEIGGRAAREGVERARPRSGESAGEILKNKAAGDGGALEPSFLTAEDFQSLPKKGTVNPWRVRFSQDSAGETFKAGGGIDQLVADLRLNSAKAQEIPPIRIVVKDGQVYTLDNRRLWVFQEAGVDIRYIKLDAIPRGEMFKFTTTNQGVNIQIRRREQ